MRSWIFAVAFPQKFGFLIGCRIYFIFRFHGFSLLSTELFIGKLCLGQKYSIPVFKFLVLFFSKCSLKSMWVLLNMRANKLQSFSPVLFCSVVIFPVMFSPEDRWHTHFQHSPVKSQPFSYNSYNNFGLPKSCWKTKINFSHHVQTVSDHVVMQKRRTFQFLHCY